MFERRGKRQGTSTGDDGYELDRLKHLFVVDDLGNVLQGVRRYKGVGSFTSDYTYHSDGVRNSMTNLAGTWSYLYDKAGRYTLQADNINMDIREIVDSIARSRGYKRQRKNHYFRLHDDVYHLLHIDKGTWSRTYQLNFCISLDFSPVPKSPLTRATIEECGAPCAESRVPAEEALSFDSEFSDEDARERLLAYFKCVDEWMYGLGNSESIRAWIKSHNDFYIEGSYVRRGIYEFLELPIPTKSRPK